jgi:hypothetical protein
MRALKKKMKKKQIIYDTYIIHKIEEKKNYKHICKIKRKKK